MRGGTAATGLSKKVPSHSKNLMEDVFDEQYEQELKQQVDAEVAAYAKTAEKLEAAIKAGDVDLKNLQH
ncbi:unnamed protein product [Mesocestoides corti]|uniref:ATP synthase subunit d, mitochondrial n=1 Tax=Mesocestoides corti TaxID=53468 RepID=A0A0R3UDA9_MESCO|nr:unnamed protein product [Mesocestoides corti]